MFISRYSEDHFAIIVPAKTKEEYDDIARGLIDLFKTHFLVGNYELDASANIGICICPYDARMRIPSESKQKLHCLEQRERRKTHTNIFPLI